MLTIAECRRFVTEGDQIAEGAARRVYTHPDFPQWVVKVQYSKYLDQQSNEIRNYKRLSQTPLPAGVRIPKTFQVGSFIVQERVRGQRLRDHAPDDNRPCNCSVKFPSLPDCWETLALKVTEDAHDENVLFAKGAVWVIDLGFDQDYGF